MGITITLRGYKLHWDVADGQIPISAYSGASRTAFRGEAEQDSGLIPNSIPG